MVAMGNQGQQIKAPDWSKANCFYITFKPPNLNQRKSFGMHLSFFLIYIYHYCFFSEAWCFNACIVKRTLHENIISIDISRLFTKDPFSCFRDS